MAALHCDNFNTAQSAIHGLAVSGFASTPFNVAVGGTDFDQIGRESQFWDTSTTSIVTQPIPSSAKSYIPEVPWNDSCAQHGLLHRHLHKATNRNRHLLAIRWAFRFSTDYSAAKPYERNRASPIGLAFRRFLSNLRPIQRRCCKPRIHIFLRHPGDHRRQLRSGHRNDWATFPLRQRRYHHPIILQVARHLRVIYQPFPSFLLVSLV